MLKYLLIYTLIFFAVYIIVLIFMWKNEDKYRKDLKRYRKQHLEANLKDDPQYKELLAAFKGAKKKTENLKKTLNIVFLVLLAVVAILYLIFK